MTFIEGMQNHMQGAYLFYKHIFWCKALSFLTVPNWPKIPVRDVPQIFYSAHDIPLAPPKKTKNQNLMPNVIRNFRIIKGCNAGFPRISERGRTENSDIGKDITSDSFLTITILVIREKTVGCKMPKEMKVEMLKDFEARRNLSNRKVIGRFEYSPFFGIGYTKACFLDKRISFSV